MAGQDWLEKDFYKTLGVSNDASSDDIKKKYRKLAREHHPDANSGNLSAEIKFKEITEAYTVLSDSKQRQQYDSIKAMGAGGGFPGNPGSGYGNEAGFEDIFSSVFSRPNANNNFSGNNLPPEFANFFGGSFHSTPPKGRDISSKVNVTFGQSIFGAVVEIRIGNGKTVKFSLPVGVEDGQKIRLKGKGEPSPGGNGDLLITVFVESHPIFVREKNNIRIALPITFPEATLGAKIKIPTLSGENLQIKIPAGTSSGSILRVKNKGLTSAKTKGDLLIVVEVIVPQKISNKAKKAVESFAEATSVEDPRAKFLELARL